MNTKLFFPVILLAILCICSIAFAQEPAPPTHEEITLTTYYPAPYGEYNSLSVGDPTEGYTATNPGELLVQGNLGIGVVEPQGRLDVGDRTDPEFGVCPAGYSWVDYDGNGFVDNGECWRGMVVQSGNLGIGTTSPDASYRLDVNGKIKGGGTAEAWSANRTSYLVATSGGPWTTIPGLSITFTLSRDALVQMMATGVQRTPNQAGGTVIHCAYRFMVDGAARGDPTYGQRINVSRGDCSWWNPWSLSDFANLSAGSHTIEVQACNGAGVATAIICGEVGPSTPDYTQGNLNILAVYD